MCHSYRNVLAKKGKGFKVGFKILEEGSTGTIQGEGGIMVHREIFIWLYQASLEPHDDIEVHLGSKGFFRVVFANIEDEYRVFNGVPYLFSYAGLYMQSWKEKFTPDKETFTNVLVWFRLYSLPSY